MGTRIHKDWVRGAHERKHFKECVTPCISRFPKKRFLLIPAVWGCPLLMLLLGILCWSFFECVKKGSGVCAVADQRAPLQRKSVLFPFMVQA